MDEVKNGLMDEDTNVDTRVEGSGDGKSDT